MFHTFVVTVAWRDNRGVGDGGGGRYGGGGRVQDEVTPRLPLASIFVQKRGIENHRRSIEGGWGYFLSIVLVGL